MIQDLHSHTYYSFCGKDRPEAIVEAAIEGGIEVFGICDHNYGVGFGSYSAFAAPPELIPNRYEGRNLRRYFDHINLIKEKYADRIRILRGIEIATDSSAGKVTLPPDADISFFDYCLIEHIDRDATSVADLFAFAKRCGCPLVGVAHTDLFGYCEKTGQDPCEFFSKMAEAGIFWEMNVSYDSIHGYKEHEYMLRFFASEKEQDLIRRSGVRLSVGFDGHRVEDYRPDRVRDYCERVKALGIGLVLDE